MRRAIALPAVFVDATVYLAIFFQFLGLGVLSGKYRKMWKIVDKSVSRRTR